MISVEQHRARILAAVRPCTTHVVALDGPGWPADVIGRVVTQDVTALVELPAFTNSAMDGYAVRFADVQAHSLGVAIPVSGDIPAGDTRDLTVVPGQAWRIMTGAPVPEGADTIVPVEHTDAGVRDVRFTGDVAPGRHIRVQGEDVRVGDVVLPGGTRLTPHHVAVLASSGAITVTVRRPSRVLVVSTGDELRPAGTALRHGQIHDSNGPMLAALVEAAGGELLDVLHVPDDAEELTQVLARAAQEADAVVTTGGVSAGAFDVVKEALLDAGEVTFDRVAVQPGKPQGFGLIGARGVPVFTLPGNPMSTLVSFHVFVLPALDAMAGRGPRPVSRGIVKQGWRAPPERAQYARVSVAQEGEHLVIRPNARQGSHHLGELSEANALALVPAEVNDVRPGDQLDVMMLLTGR